MLHPGKTRSFGERKCYETYNGYNLFQNGLSLAILAYNMLSNNKYLVLSYASSPNCLISYVRPNRTKKDQTGSYGTIGDHTGPYGTIQDHTRTIQEKGNIQDNTRPYGPYRTIWEPVPHNTIQYLMVPYGTMSYQAVPYGTKSNHMVPYHTVPISTISYHTSPYCTIRDCLVPLRTICITVYCIVN